MGSRHVDGQKANISAPPGDRVEPVMQPDDARPFPSPLIAFLASHGTLTWILLALAIVGILCILIITPGCGQQTSPAARFDLGAGTIDWFQFTDANVEQLATEMWVEPNIYANWKIYGGLAIADPGAKAAANSNGGAAQ